MRPKKLPTFWVELEQIRTERVMVQVEALNPSEARVLAERFEPKATRMFSPHYAVMTAWRTLAVGDSPATARGQDQ